MMGRRGTGGSKGSPDLPAEMALHTILFLWLCRGSRSAYARPRCLWLPQQLLAQHVHDEDITIGACVNQGKLRESVRKRTVRRAAGEQAIGMAVAARAPLCSMPVRSSFFSRGRQVCSSDKYMLAHSGMLLCMRSSLGIALHWKKSCRPTLPWIPASLMARCPRDFGNESHPRFCIRS